MKIISNFPRKFSIDLFPGKLRKFNTGILGRFYPRFYLYFWRKLISFYSHTIYTLIIPSFLRCPRFLSNFSVYNHCFPTACLNLTRKYYLILEYHHHNEHDFISKMKGTCANMTIYHFEISCHKFFSSERYQLGTCATHFPNETVFLMLHQAYFIRLNI